MIVQKASKIAPRAPQDAPRGPQDRPKIAQDGPKTAPRSAKMAPSPPKMPQDRPKIAQEAARSPLPRPRRPQEGSRLPPAPWAPLRCSMATSKRAPQAPGVAGAGFPRTLVFPKGHATFWGAAGDPPQAFSIYAPWAMCAVRGSPLMTSLFHMSSFPWFSSFPWPCGSPYPLFLVPLAPGDSGIDARGGGGNQLFPTGGG